MSVEGASCSRRQEPRLIRTEEKCSEVGADGRTDGLILGSTSPRLTTFILDLSELVRVSIGWQIGEVYHEQIGICHDEKVFSTIWSNYTLQGGSIDFRLADLSEKVLKVKMFNSRDIDSRRPSFRWGRTEI